MTMLEARPWVATPDGITGKAAKGEEIAVVPQEAGRTVYGPAWVLRALRRNIALLLGSVLACLALAGVYLILAQPKYMATSQLIIDLRQPRIISDNPILQSLGADQYVIDSQVEVIRSRSVINRVIDQLGLDNPNRTPGTFGSGNGAAGKAGNASTSHAEEEAHRDAFIERISKNLTVQRKGLSFVIEIGYTDPDPADAALVANALVEAYLGEQRDSKIATVEAANKWLVARVEELRARVAEAERRVQRFKAEHNIVDGSQSTAPELELAEYTKQLAVARATLTDAHAKLQQVEKFAATPELMDTMPQSLESRVISELRAQYALIRAKQGLLLARYGREHPQALEAQAEADNLLAQIREESQRIVESTRTNHDVAANRVKMLEERLDTVKRELNRIGSTAVGLAELERDAKVTAAIYGSFLTRLKETQAQETLQASDGRILSLATKPASPAKPKKLLILALALGAGLSLGSMLAFARDAFSRTFRDLADLKDWTNVPILAVLPAVSEADLYGTCDDEGATRWAAGSTVLQGGPLAENPGPQVLEDREHPFSQAICVLNDAIEQAVPAGRPKVVAVVSPRQGEGKSIIASSIARHASSVGINVLLIDCDTYSPSLRTAARSRLDAMDGQVDTAKSRLMVVPLARAGDTRQTDIVGPRALTALIASVRDRCDLVVLDTSSFLDYVDTKLMMRAVDYAVVVTELGATARADLADTIEGVNAVKPRLLGLVVNKAPT